MAVSKQPSITPETSSGEGLDEEPTSRGEAKWKRFHPFRVVRKIFRRRVKRQGTGEERETSKKSWSTSELQSVQDIPDKYEVPSPPYKIGLSVSHDSIFSPESSNLVSSEELNRPQGSSLSVQHAGIKNMFKDELFSRVRARRDSEDDDDDIGLPHSPCTSPTTVDVLTQGLKAKSLKSGSLSAGSLISMGSSENDEDSAVASSSGNSSRMSLLDRRSLDFEGDPELYQPIPLNHNAAHHKIAVRPKRTHGLPQKRLKQQLAASHLSTLPTTPEVTEDNGKAYVKSESAATADTVVHEVVTMVTSTSAENILSECITESVTSCSTIETSLLQKTSLIHTSVSESSFQTSQVISNEIVDNTVMQLADGFVLNSVEVEENKDLSKQDVSVTTTNKVAHEETVQNIEEMQKDSFQSFVHTTTSVNEDSCIKSAHSLKSTVKPEEKNDGNLLDEMPLRVSALIKNIEKSDSLGKHTKDLNLKVGAKQSGAKCDVNDTSEDSKTSYLSHGDNEGAPINIMDEVNSVTSAKNYADVLFPPSEPNSSAGNSELDVTNTSPVINNENLVQNEQNSLHHSFVESQLRMEIRHQFEQQKSIKSQEQSHAIVSSSFPEEESIMSDKYVSSRVREKPEDTCVIVSHQITDITEARNLVTVDKSFNLNIHDFHSQNAEESLTKNTNSETWVNDQNIASSSLDNNISNVMVNSLPSSVYSQKIVEDKVTISINSRTDELELNKKGNEVFTAPKEIDEKKIPQPLSANSQPVSSYNNKPCRPEGIKPPLKEKSVARIKNADPSKRVSVEIVPFSQRMKDRKYQPLLFPNKGATTDSARGSTGVAAVERNLSDRRINTKSKDTEKSNNRHSFSGALSDVEKPIATDKKQSSKSDKIHYPIQIRIHKSKMYEKENLFEKAKANKEIKKSPSPDPSTDSKRYSQSSKAVNDGKNAGEIQAKWEVKVQSTSIGKKETSETLIHHDGEEVKLESSNKSTNVILSPQTSEPKYVPPQSLISQKDMQEKSSPPNTLIESSLLKSRENTRKSTRETPPSEDPEPELLRVFARRSIKQKHCDKEKPDEQKDIETKTVALGTPSDVTSRDGDIPQNNQELSVTTPPPPPLKDGSTQELFQNTLKSPDLVKKKSKSFCEKEKPGPHYVAPLKEVGLNRRPSLKATSPEVCELENFHRRQRLVSEPDVAPTLPPGTENSGSVKSQQNNLSTDSVSLTCRSEHLQRGPSLSTSPSSSLSNGTSSSITIDTLKSKENPDALSSCDAPAPSWLQLAQQRRELREQRERLLIGSSTNSFLDASSKPSRSSKVWDMVNNFQKMQMT